MAEAQPTLTIGLPVFNGERYLRTSVESILGQSYRDFELIISDNASTDDTETIGRALAAEDDRVSYRRNARNLGLTRNWNLLVPLARGRLFKWAAGDDSILPGFLERCVRAVEADPDVVLAYARAAFVDADGRPLDMPDPGWHLVSDDAAKRLTYAIYATHFVNALHGVIRVDALRGTRLMAGYPAGDYRLMAELAALGKIVEVPERLFVRRIHEGSTKGNAGDDSWLRRYWSGTSNGSRATSAPSWRLYRDYATILARAPVPLGRKPLLYAHLARQMVSQRSRLLGELIGLARR